jgi:ABC-type branched-subunit amino acid transport system substrate-binding protein
MCLSTQEELTQEEFDRILEDLPTLKKKILELTLTGFSNREIGRELFPFDKKPEKNVAAHISHIYKKFEIEQENAGGCPFSRRDRLIKLFYRFKRNWLIPPLFDEWTSINSGFYLQPGIEYLDRQEYYKAIEMFEKAKKSDPKDPIVQIYLNNAKAHDRDKAHLYRKPLKIAVVVAYQNDSHRDAADNVLRGVADAQTKFNDAQARLNQSDCQPRRLVEVMIVNDRNDPRTAKRVAEILCLDRNILAVIGHHSGEGTQAAKAVYEENNIAIISPTSTSSRLESNILFRTVGSTSIVAETYAEYIINDLRRKEVYICYHINNVYSQTIHDDCIRVFTKRGITIIGSTSIHEPHEDLKSLIGNISSSSQSKVMLILSSIATNPAALVLIYENLQLGANKLRLLLSTAMSESLIADRGINAIENLALVTPDIPVDSVYVKNAKSRWGQSNLDWRVACSYDAAQALIEAIRRSEEPIRREILENLRGLRLGIDRTSGCGLEFSKDNSNIFMKYRIDTLL